MTDTDLTGTPETLCHALLDAARAAGAKNADAVVMSGAAITIDDEKNAYPGRPRCIARGTFNTASTFSSGTAHNTG